MMSAAEKRKLKTEVEGPSKKVNTGEHYFEVQPEVEVSPPRTGRSSQ